MSIFQLANIIKGTIVPVKDFLTSINWQEIIFIMKIVLIVVSVLFFVGIVFLVIGLNIVSRVKESGKLLVTPTHFPKKLMKRWVRVEMRLKSNQEAELKLAVIEADKFFDDILKKSGYSGKDMGERLGRINSSQVANIDDIWQAHKIRNNIVHDIDYKLTESEAEKAIGAYKKALEELEVL